MNDILLLTGIKCAIDVNSYIFEQEGPLCIAIFRIYDGEILTLIIKAVQKKNSSHN